MDMYYGLMRPEEAQRILKSGRVAECGEYLTIEETADVLGLGDCDVELLLLSGRLSSKPNSRKVRISKLSLVRFLLRTYDKQNNLKLYQEL